MWEGLVSRGWRLCNDCCWLSLTKLLWVRRTVMLKILSLQLDLRAFLLRPGKLKKEEHGWDGLASAVHSVLADFGVTGVMASYSLYQHRTSHDGCFLSKYISFLMPASWSWGDCTWEVGGSEGISCYLFFGVGLTTNAQSLNSLVEMCKPLLESLYARGSYNFRTQGKIAV